MSSNYQRGQFNKIVFIYRAGFLGEEERSFFASHAETNFLTTHSSNDETDVLAKSISKPMLKQTFDHNAHILDVLKLIFLPQPIGGMPKQPFW
jgi:hypothetical protein